MLSARVEGIFDGVKNVFGPRKHLAKSFGTGIKNDPFLRTL